MENTILVIQPTVENLTCVSYQMKMISVDEIDSVIQYDYSASIEALEKKAEMFALTKKTIFEKDTNSALVIDKTGDKYELPLSTVSQQFKDKYLNIISL